MTQIQGKFVGKLAPEWLDNGRQMKLKTNFTFIDGNEFRWIALKGTMIDGASIPQFLWSFIGGPFEGKYRKASVVHDYFCIEKKQHWQKVHRMFYEACLVEGLREFQAKFMYAGVYAGGPRWEYEAVPEASDSGESFGSYEFHSYKLIPPKDFTENTKNWIKEQNPSIDEIENHINSIDSEIVSI